MYSLTELHQLLTVADASITIDRWSTPHSTSTCTSMRTSFAKVPPKPFDHPVGHP
jgi:hypothetical protein